MTSPQARRLQFPACLAVKVLGRTAILSSDWTSGQEVEDKDKSDWWRDLFPLRLRKFVCVPGRELELGVTSGVAKPE